MKASRTPSRQEIARPTGVKSAVIAPTYQLANDFAIPELRRTLDEMGLRYDFIADPKRYCFVLPDLGTRKEPSEILIRTETNFAGYLKDLLKDQTTTVDSTAAVTPGAFPGAYPYQFGGGFSGRQAEVGEGANNLYRFQADSDDLADQTLDVLWVVFAVGVVDDAALFIH